MIDAATRARIRQLFYAEHWRIGTISTELGVHRDAVRNAIETDRFVRAGTQSARRSVSPASSARSSTTTRGFARRMLRARG
jgi:hypothetical protein